jgi:transposase-like protein
METVRKKHSLEFKISSVNMSIKCGSVIDVARELGISKHNLFHWKKLYKDGKLTSTKLSTSAITKEDLLKLRKEVKK